MPLCDFFPWYLSATREIDGSPSLSVRGETLGLQGMGEEVGQRVTYIVSCIHKTNMKYSVYDLGERVKGVFSPGMMIGS